MPRHAGFNAGRGGKAAGISPKDGHVVVAGSKDRLDKNKTRREKLSEEFHFKKYCKEVLADRFEGLESADLESQREVVTEVFREIYTNKEFAPNNRKKLSIAVGIATLLIAKFAGEFVAKDILENIHFDSVARVASGAVIGSAIGGPVGAAVGMIVSAKGAEGKEMRVDADGKLAADEELELKIKSASYAYDPDEAVIKRMNSDPKFKRQVMKKFDAFREKFENDVRNAAAEGPKTRALMMQCLENVQIVLVDEEYSRSKIVRGPLQDNAGLYSVDSKQLVIRNFAQNLGLIIHECGHAKEQLEGTQYDKKKLEACSKKLHTLGIGMIECLDGVKTECDDEVKMASKWGHRVASKTIAHDPTPHREVRTNRLHRSADAKSFPDLKEITVRMGLDCKSLIDGVDSCSTELVAIGGRGPSQSDVTRSPTQVEKELFTAASDIADIKTKDELGRRYSSAEILSETNAQHWQHVPESVLDEVCSVLQLDQKSRKRRNSK